MSRAKRKPEQFDVVDFLRESDTDLKSALNSLLRSPVDTGGDTGGNPSSAPGINLIPPPELPLNSEVDSRLAVAHPEVSENGPAINSSRPSILDPGITLAPGFSIAPASILAPGPNLDEHQATAPAMPRGAVNSEPALTLRPGPELSKEPKPYSRAQSLPIPAVKLTPGPILATPVRTVERISVDNTDSPINLIPGPGTEQAPKKRQFPIREMKLAQDAHTRAEQQVYEYLWQSAKPLDDVSRTITIGFGAMARMVRLSESNARINVRGLIAKLAIEEFGDYNCERSLGRTYRVLNYSEILKRRRAAGLIWYMRRTLAVVFVDPSTGQPLDLGGKKAKSPSLTAGPNLTRGRGSNLTSAPGPNLTAEPGANLGPLNREQEREHNLSQTSSSSDEILFQALSQYGIADDDVLTRLRAETRRICPDFTDDELVWFIHSKGQLIHRPNSSISSPIGFLLTSVPKCFAGEAFQLFRKTQRETREREAAERAQQEADLANWRREQQAILDDPAATEEDKKWARKALQLDNA